MRGAPVRAFDVNPGEREVRYMRGAPVRAFDVVPARTHPPAANS